MTTTFTLEDVKRLANQFAENHLNDYLNDLKTATPPAVFTRKEINDALWGTIGLSPIEVVILDSPLLQRLRYIRQLGVVHWVYPGANHTRFDHTLGVLFQVQHLTTALNALGDPSRPLIKSTLVQLLRISALLHDIGHASFSHVSEIVVQSLNSVSQICASFSKMLRCEERKLSEIFAYYIVKSPAMEVFLEYALDVTGNPIILEQDKKRNISRIVEIISNTIIGQKIDDQVPLLHEIISGPFDSDKLDYYVRDARLAGIPVVLDITRLVQKLAVRELPSSELPREIASRVQVSDTPHYIFGLKWSGVALLDELQLARVLLYAKIYRHPKVIAIEQMLRAMILSIGCVATPEQIITFLYSVPDDVLLNLNTKTLAESLGIDFNALETGQLEYLQQASDLLKSIRLRRLWVRAFGLLRKYPDESENEMAQHKGLIEFRENIEHPQGVEQFRKELIDELIHITQILEVSPALTRSQLEFQVMIHALKQTPGSSQIARAYLMPPSGKPSPFREYHVNRGAWADSYLSDQPAGFIFCSPHIADLVYLAVEKLIRINYSQALPTSAIEVSKRDLNRISDIRQKLHESGYYKNVAYDLRPIPKLLNRADSCQIIDKFNLTLTRYLEPLHQEFLGEQNGKPPKEKIFDWLRQFDNDNHIECALRLLENFRMLTRDDTVHALKKFIDENPSFKGALVIPFGSAKDSAAIQTYFAADVVGTYITECTTLSEAAKSKTDLPLIFIDDFVASGGQGSDILAAGFGLDEMRKDLGEQRNIFDSDEQDLLQKAKVGFVFTAAWDTGIDVIKKSADEVGISSIVFRLLNEGDIPFAFSSNIFEGIDPEIVESFKERCEEIGKDLIKKPGDEPEKVESRKLGYGNRAMLLASPFNVPTQTLTSIWASGTVDELPWQPLMFRRKKQ